MSDTNTAEKAAASGSADPWDADNPPQNCDSALPTPDQIKANPDRILELYECCPNCGSTALEALTWKSIGSDAVTVGCWNCEWWITPPGYAPDTQNDQRQATASTKQ